MGTASWRRGAAGVVAAMMALTIAIAVPTPAPARAAADPAVPARMRDEPVVHGTPVKPRPPEPSVTDQRALQATPPVSWPAGTAEVAVPGRSTAGAANPVRVGELPVVVAAGRATDDAATPGRVRVALLDRAESTKAGVAGLLLRVRRADREPGAGKVMLGVDYASLRYAYGGDWTSRLRMVELGDRPVVIPSHNDPEAGQLTAEVTIDGITTLAVTAGPSGPTGDYTATPLSSAGSWQVAANSGSFSWSYPLPMPATPGGLDPQLALSYSSASVDGSTASTNNQPSWLGEGWELSPGFIERSYRGCHLDGGPETGDLCWAGDHVSLSLGGRSGELIRDDATGKYRLRDDDGTRVEQLFGAGNGDDNGEYWKLTTTDGVQHIFGQSPDATWTVPVFGNQAGEPCHSGTFATSWCDQGWRWNLTQVVDPHQSTITYAYAEETNSYAMNLGSATRSYTRGGHLLRVDYGQRVGQPGAAPARVVFHTAERCLPGSACAQTAADYPDVPWDLRCVQATCPGKHSPAFFTTKRLSKITTEIRSGTGYQPVDEWALRHTFPVPGDGTSASLWLAGVTRTGLVGGSMAVPEISFDGDPYENRVNSAPDGLPPMTKFRMGRIHNESGGTINVVYAPVNCDRTALPQPGNNTQRCFPVHWTPELGQPLTDWFHKYVVARTTEDDRVGGNATQVTNYEYVGGAAWRFNDHPVTPVERRTWSQWRGYTQIIQRDGDPTDTGNPRSATRYTYLRGMNGDPLPGGGTRSVSVTDSQGGVLADDDELAGFLREQITHNGGSPADPVVSGTIYDPWRRGPTASQGGRKAFMVDVGSERTRVALTGGTWRNTRVDTTYNDERIATQVHDRGDVASGDDDRCTTITHARNAGSWLLNLPARVSTVAVACGQPASHPADAVSDVRTYYDGSDTLGAPPAAGDPTKVEEASSYTGGVPAYVTVSRASFDSYGRVLQSHDALDRRTTTAYTDPDGLTTSTRVTSPDPDGSGSMTAHVSTIVLDPARGLPTSKADPNGRATTLRYDPLGRLTEVRLPGSALKANLKFGYQLRSTGPSWVMTQRLDANRSYQSSYQLFDGFLRARQTQAPAWGGGRALTDTIYDSRGLVAKANAPYRDNAAPGTTLLEVPDNQVPGQTVTKHDGAGRPIESILLRQAEQRWRSVTAYGGDRVHVTPPPGAPPTTTITDARGRTTELRHYRDGTPPTGTTDSTRYTYTRAGQLATVTDPAGNWWSYEYDVRGRKVRAIDPDKGVATMAYDNAGQLLSTTDFRGQKLIHTYDGLGRKTEQRDGSTGALLASWRYDSLLKGMPSSSTRHEGGAAYLSEVTGYDAAYRPTGRRIIVPAMETGLSGTYTTAMSYRDDGSLGTLTLPAAGGLSSETVTFTYDGLGLPRTMTSGLGEYVTDTKYTPYRELGQLQLGPSGARVWQTRYYEDGTRRLTEARAERQHPTDTQLEHYWYSYDPAGNVTRIADKPEGHTADVQCFRYDVSRQLTSAWTPTVDDCAPSPSTPLLGGPARYWIAYEYDSAGNRTMETRHATTVGATGTVRRYDYPEPGEVQPHTLSSVTTTGPAGTRIDRYTYDQAGNTLTRPGQQLTWDVEGRLAAVSTEQGTARAVYDADGDRLIRHDPGSRTLYLEGQELTYDLATKAKSVTRHYSHAGSTVAVRSQAGLSWLTGDHHGTSTAAVDASSGDVTRRRFEPFGNPRGGQPTWPGEHGFVGGVQDANTGLTHLGAREYDPAIGRFISVDPIMDVSDPQQMHGYAYANSNPTTLSDPTGLIPGARCPDGECPFGTPGGGYKPGQSPASRFNAWPEQKIRNGQGARCPDGARTCRAVPGWSRKPAPTPPPASNRRQQALDATAGWMDQTMLLATFYREGINWTLHSITGKEPPRVDTGSQAYANGAHAADLASDVVSFLTPGGGVRVVVTKGVRAALGKGAGRSAGNGAAIQVAPDGSWRLVDARTGKDWNPPPDSWRARVGDKDVEFKDYPETTRQLKDTRRGILMDGVKELIEMGKDVAEWGVDQIGGSGSW